MCKKKYILGIFLEEIDFIFSHVFAINILAVIDYVVFIVLDLNGYQFIHDLRCPYAKYFDD